MELIFNNYLSLSDEAKSRLQYHKFISPHRENCNTKLISSLDILTNKGISNQYLNCYISASVHPLLGTAICAMLPNLLENDSVLNNKLHYVKKKLHSEGSSTYSFTQYDRKRPFPKVPVLGQILEEVMQKNYLEKEMVDAGSLLINFWIDYLQIALLNIPLKLCLEILISVLHAGV